MQAYILVSVEKGREQAIYEELVSMVEVTGAHLLFGEWDVICKVSMLHSEELTTLILDKIRPLKGVSMTSTLIVAK